MKTDIESQNQSIIDRLEDIERRLKLEGLEQRITVIETKITKAEKSKKRITNICRNIGLCIGISLLIVLGIFGFLVFLFFMTYENN